MKLIQIYNEGILDIITKLLSKKQINKYIKDNPEKIKNIRSFYKNIEKASQNLKNNDIKVSTNAGELSLDTIMNTIEKKSKEYLKNK